MAFSFVLRLGKDAGGDPIVIGEMQTRRIVRRVSISDEIIAGQLSGSWIDLLASDGRVIYRRLLGDPYRGAEVPRDDTGTLVSLRPRDTATLRVLLPSLPGAETIVFMHSAATDRAALPLYRARMPA